jgi:hypothetical protein
MEDALLSCAYESRTRQVAEELYDPMAQLNAEITIAIAQGVSREMITSFSR